MSATATPQSGAVRAPGPGARRRRRPLSILGWAVMLLLAALVLVAAVCNLQGRTHIAWDSHALIQIAFRSEALGEPYYVAGADLKGPLWIAPYDLALRVANFYTVWFVVGALLIAVAVAIAILTFRVAANAGPARWPAAGVATAIALWLFLGPEEYASTLYSRNWLALLWVATVAALTALPRVPPRRQLALAALGGATTGVAVQTNISSAPTALLMFLVLAWLTLFGPLAGTRRLARIPLLLAAFAGASVLGLASVFGWYAVRGGLHDFWWYWWDWSKDYGAGPGNGFSGILQKGWDDFVVYYRARPIIPLVALIFLADAVRRRRARQPIWIDVTLVLWLLSECLVVAISQRFFPHYLILPLVPAGVMAAVLAARWGGRLPVGVQRVAPVFLGFCALWFGNWHNFTDGIRAAREFSGTAGTVADNIAAESPDRQQARTAVHTIAGAGAWGIIWTIYPYDYTDLDLRSAIRYVPRSWLTGEQPGAGASENFVRPGAWDRFWQDIRRTPPKVIVFHTAEPLPAGKPIAALAACAFKTAYVSPDWTVMRRKETRPIEQCLPRS